MSDLYIGMLSGTSADGVDTVLVDFSSPIPKVIAKRYQPFALDLKQKIFGLYTPGENEINRLGELDHELGQIFAQSVNDLLQESGIPKNAIKAIGSHGQNVRHAPQSTFNFTLQIGDPNRIASKTGITTIADFRRKDLVLGGQGAPLVPKFHQMIFQSTHSHRMIVNIGGIANVTLLSQDPKQPIIGFDTGPGNALLDAWIQMHTTAQVDQHGEFARTGQIRKDLLNALLADPYFQRIPPKSTGREYFNLPWLNTYLQHFTDWSSADVQATLTELTAQTILNALNSFFNTGEIFICGGGAHNDYLLERLTQLANPTFTVATTNALGIDPDWIEAMAFAWLAKQTLNNCPGNIPSVTGAKEEVVLGGIYYAK